MWPPTSPRCLSNCLSFGWMTRKCIMPRRTSPSTGWASHFRPLITTICWWSCPTKPACMMALSIRSPLSLSAWAVAISPAQGPQGPGCRHFPCLAPVDSPQTASTFLHCLINFRSMTHPRPRPISSLMLSPILCQTLSQPCDQPVASPQPPSAPSVSVSTCSVVERSAPSVATAQLFWSQLLLQLSPLDALSQWIVSLCCCPAPLCRRWKPLLGWHWYTAL
jgi:hypothetical protein